MIEQIVFYSMAGLVILSALAVVTLRNAVHSALFLGLCLAGVAGLFASLGADFLFAGQVLIYVGAVAVLVMFVVMLLGRASDLHLRQINNQWLAGLLICAVSMAGFMHVIRLFAKTLPASEPLPGTRLIGKLMMSDYAVPFELVSLVLLAALLGAVYFSRAEKGAE
jgi:NADH-quinone oxidoreductase subunit J